ncbi:hypothetical protein Bca4012_087720 [Brassica carinata]
MHCPQPSLPRQGPHAKGREHGTTAANMAIWRGNARRRNEAIADVVTAAVRRDIYRGIAQHYKERMREGHNPNSREDKPQGQERTPSRVAKEPNQSRVCP